MNDGRFGKVKTCQDYAWAAWERVGSMKVISRLGDLPGSAGEWAMMNLKVRNKKKKESERG